MNKTLFSWSSGKDAALAYYYLKQQQEVHALFTTINSAYQRVSMHGLRHTLLTQQAQALNTPLITVNLPQHTTMASYNKAMKKCLIEQQTKGFTQCGFGDIFLEDLKEYREKFFSRLGYTTHFPLWKKDTKALAQELISLGLKAITICVKVDVLGSEFVGRNVDDEFLSALPPNVDPCGENGEFHTFCYDGPIFDKPIPLCNRKNRFSRLQNNTRNTPNKRKPPRWLLVL